MQHSHQDPLYRASRNAACDRPSGSSRGLSAELRRLAALRGHSSIISSSTFHKTGRNPLTRAVDSVLEFIRKYLPPIHWLATYALAVLLYSYARVVQATVEIVTVGCYQWPDLPKGSVLAFWHGCAPSLLVAFHARRPSFPIKVMISRDARGDYVALFCRWLGFEIIRGDAQHGAWKALLDIANDVQNGAGALISPDGGGPPRVARVGAVAVASAARVPLIAIGTECRPALFERHKWDRARNPLPYGRIAIACGKPLVFPLIEDADSLERARQQLQDALDHVTNEASTAVVRR